ncbi:MAG: NAD(+) synthase [Thioalkalivibrionaceae bacterium]
MASTRQAMSHPRIGLIQSNPTVGALESNVDGLLTAVASLRAEAGAAPLLLVTGELALTGYPPEDLLLRPAFLDAVEAQVMRLAAAARGVDVVVGAPWRPRPALEAGRYPALDARPQPTGTLHNAALWLRDGAIHAVYAKRLLPNYAVFDERRYFVAGEAPCVVEWCGSRVALAICEDVWAPEPLRQSQAAGADWCLSLHASPWHRDKVAERAAALRDRVVETGLPIVYVNLVGGQDELVFDGRSCLASPSPRGAGYTDARAEVPASAPAAGPTGPGPGVFCGASREGSTVEGDRVERVSGECVGEAAAGPCEPSGAVIDSVLSAWTTGTAALHLIDRVPRWVSASDDLLCRDDGRDPTGGRRGNTTSPASGPMGSVEDDTWAALCLGLGDYARKNGFDSAVLGLSGGIDSAVVVALATEVFGRDRVTALMLPYRYTSALSLDLAAELAGNLGIDYHVIDLVKAVDAAEAAFATHLDRLPADRRAKPAARALTHENLQSRMRGNILMGWSNATGALLLACGNKSEMTVGYATLYGDMAGGFSPLKDVTKGWVYRLAEAYNRRAAAEGRLGIPAAIVDRPPSAELAPNQADTDSLPEYALLDRLIELMVEQDCGVDELIAEGFPADAVRQLARLLRHAEYKRRQSAPGVRVTRRAFGRDRRYPITSRFFG